MVQIQLQRAHLSGHHSTIRVKGEARRDQAGKAVEQLFCTTSVGHIADEREDVPEIAEMLVTSSQRWHDMVPQRSQDRHLLVKVAMHLFTKRVLYQSQLRRLISELLSMAEEGEEAWENESLASLAEGEENAFDGRIGRRSKGAAAT
uniref:Uncharacterized protein n=1 Tax=Globodera rostochiensis TaxID=31243 RepID=A0A914HQQ9_GLORO